jgi:hypothetical protein
MGVVRDGGMKWGFVKKKAPRGGGLVFDGSPKATLFINPSIPENRVQTHNYQSLVRGQYQNAIHPSLDAPWALH